MCILQSCAAVSSEVLPWFVFSWVQLPARMMEITYHLYGPLNIHKHKHYWDQNQSAPHYMIICNISSKVCMEQTFAVVAHQSWDVFITVSQPLIGIHLVSYFSERVSCQSQRRFLEEMGESSTGDMLIFIFGIIVSIYLLCGKLMPPII